MTQNTALSRAIEFARAAHADVGQVRKYTGEPYIVHPIEVMGLLVANAEPRFRTDECLMAAVLHDTVEDTPVTIFDINHHFGYTVAIYVMGLTDVFVSGYEENGRKLNRAERKAREAERISKCCPEVQTIKLADLLSNSKTIITLDKGFARTYLPEKRAILAQINDADENLLRLARERLVECEEILRDT
jgi:(p)ppGpp synthase/HD superfamily hydrolase